MAIPSANAMHDKIQFTTGGAGVGGDVHRQWFPDERDSFIYWIRGEFAAANAIIDSLCQHLRSIGDPGEYDMVFGCVQQRRFNWNPVLHMQQYFSVAEIVYALQQASWRKQQRYYDNFKPAGKDMKKYSTHGGFRQRQILGTVKDAANIGTECNNSHPPKGENSFGLGKGELEIENSGEPDGAEDKVKVNDNNITEIVYGKKGGEDGNEFVPSEPCYTNSKNRNGIGYCTGQEVKIENGGCTSNTTDSSSGSVDNSSQPVLHQNGKQSLPFSPKTFCGTEMFDGKTVNVVDGLKLYEEVYDSLEVSKFLTVVNDLRAAGKKGQLQGQTFMASKRPAKGRGREFIQMGVSIVDAPPEDESIKGAFFDKRIQAIPTPLQDVINQLHDKEVMINKPDSCIVDFYNQGDYSQPHIWPPWFCRPVCILCLTECNMVFGRSILADQHGDYRGALQVSLLPGSLLVMDGKSADFAKHAIPSLANHCTLLTFAKSQPRRADASPASWPHSPIRVAVSVPHHPAGAPPKHHSPISTPVLPSPAICPPLNGLHQPLFVSPSVVPAGGFHHSPVTLPPPISTGWPTPARHLQPGTGVFLPPPGSGGSPRPQEKTAILEKDSPAAEEEEAEREVAEEVDDDCSSSTLGIM